MCGTTEAGNEVKKAFLRDKTIHYCTGYGVYSQYKKPCPQKDDATEIIEKTLSADVIVLATPVYFYTIGAQLRTLLDRCCGPYTEMINKEFYFLASAVEGKEGLSYLEYVFDNLMGFIDCLENPVVKGKVLATGVWHVGEVKGNPALTEAYEMGKQIS